LWQDDRVSHTRATTIADMLSQIDVHLRQSPGRMQPVHRLRPLPSGPARGKLLVAEGVLPSTTSILASFRGDNGPHEGIAFWLGRTVGQNTYVMSALRPSADHGNGHVLVNEEGVGAAARKAREIGLGIVAQVHSHPGTDTRHSDGDDQLIVMPFEGMYSLVVANYGAGSLTIAEGLGVHQYQYGRWVSTVETAEALVVVPPGIM
jgi:proteasome lid subunit RPN8/RPN11